MQANSFWARNGRYLLACAFLLAAVVALQLDLVVGIRALNGHIPGDLRKLVNICEVFAHGFGVAMILITIWVLDPHSRYRLARVAACALGAGLVAQSVKHLIPRIRPNVFDYHGGVQDTFVAWSQLSDKALQHISRVGLQSFPSGHTATAVALAFGLAWLYPRGKWLFAVFAFLAASQRVIAPVHYMSDALVGAAIGTFVSAVFLDRRLLGRTFDRFERGHSKTHNGKPSVVCSKGSDPPHWHCGHRSKMWKFSIRPTTRSSPTTN